MKFNGLKIKMAVVLAIMVSILVVTSGLLAISHSHQTVRSQKQQDELVMAKNAAFQDNSLHGLEYFSHLRRFANDIFESAPARQCGPRFSISFLKADFL